MARSKDRPWLVLIHNIPPKPDYLRVKIWRRLQKIGAVAIKNSVYVLPKSEQALEDFQWTLGEITTGSGEAWICEADFVEGLSNDEVEALFKAARDADYAAVAQEARDLAHQFPAGAELDAEQKSGLQAGATRLRRRLTEIAAIDFFDSLGRQTAEGLVAGLEARLRPQQPASADSAEPGSLKEFHKRTWVTRKGIHVDRMASAWLIRRFVDPQAKFKFVPAKGYRPEKDEVRFDMFQAEFTHEGDRCTFEVLLQRMKLDDAALRTIGEIVHDIDLKDSKFARPETSGVNCVITGICRAYKDDDLRLSRGSALFDDLYASFVSKA
jgi:hypothetical protein